MKHKQETSPEHKCKVLIVDDHPAVREGVAVYIAQQPSMQACCEAGSIQEGLEKIKSCQPDVAVIDISLPDGSGIDLIKRLKAANNPVKILVWSMHPDSLYAERAIKAGALGYINKENTTGKLMEAIQAVSHNELYLSPEATRLLIGHVKGERSLFEGSLVHTLSNRELEVFSMIGKGLKTSMIAEMMNISVHTVETHRRRIKIKLNLKTAGELTNRATRWLLEGE